MSNLRHIEYFIDHTRLEPKLFDGLPPAANGALTPNTTRAGHGITLAAYYLSVIPACGPANSRGKVTENPYRSARWWKTTTSSGLPSSAKPMRSSTRTGARSDKPQSLSDGGRRAGGGSSKHR